MSRTIIELNDDEINAAQAWHGGQSSMLYAVASTGALSLGTVRPRERDEHDRFVPLSDLAWKRSLVERLEGEASSDADTARERVATDDFDDGEDADELLDQALALESIARKCRAWLEANPEPEQSK